MSWINSHIVTRRIHVIEEVVALLSKAKIEQNLPEEKNFTEKGIKLASAFGKQMCENEHFTEEESLSIKHDFGLMEMLFICDCNVHTVISKIRQTLMSKVDIPSSLLFSRFNKQMKRKYVDQGGDVCNDGSEVNQVNQVNQGDHERDIGTLYTLPNDVIMYIEGMTSHENVTKSTSS